MEGFDHKISLEPNELNEMIKNIREISSIYGKGDKNISDTEMITRNKYHVSMVNINLLKKGDILEEKNIEYKNPGIGIPPKHENSVLEKKAKFDIKYKH